MNINEDVLALQGEIEKLKGEKAFLENERLLEKALMGKDVKNVSMVKALIDNEKIFISDAGEIDGLDEQIELIKKEAPTLFSDFRKVSAGGFLNYFKRDSKNPENPWLKEHFNLTKQGEIFSKDAKLANRLMKEAGLV